MAKKIVIVCFAFLLISSPVFAVGSTPSGAATPAQDLLDRVATKVAEIADKLKRAYSGKITSVGTTSYIITTADGDKTITTNDVTSFFKIRAGTATEINFQALKSGDDVTALGNIDPATNEMTAREIIAKIKRQNIAGKITAVDKGILSVQPSDGLSTQLDLGTATSTKIIALTGKVTTAKQSDFKVGGIIFAIVYQTGGDASPLSVLKAVLLTP